MSISITYYGHSCFAVSSADGTIVFDPYADHSVPGYQLPKGIRADEVSCSHGHGDHNAAELIACSGKSVYEKHILLTDHDDAGGSLRGKNRIVIIEAEDRKIAHFGDLGRDLTEAEAMALAAADLIMIPVGGYYTIDMKQADAIIQRIRPQAVILMHYRRGDKGYDVLADIDVLSRSYPIVFAGRDTVSLEGLDESKYYVLEARQ
jgi:L-ascorbate metabolism protein UlaG (beta-lactamase superfamily)